MITRKGIEKTYLQMKGIELSEEEVTSKLLSVINENLSSLVNYLGETLELTRCEKANRKEIRIIIEFFRDIEQSEPDLFEILKNLIMGSIICTLVKKDYNELKSKMAPCKVFLDTNIVFSILDYHYPEISKPCQELIELLKNS